MDDQRYQETAQSRIRTVCCSRWRWKLRSALFFSLSGEQHTYKCLSCPFSSMTISQLKEHSLRDHGETLTLQKLRAATQASHSASRPLRLTSTTEQTSITPDGNDRNHNTHLPRCLDVRTVFLRPGGGRGRVLAPSRLQPWLADCFLAAAVTLLLEPLHLPWSCSIPQRTNHR